MGISINHLFLAVTMTWLLLLAFVSENVYFDCDDEDDSCLRLEEEMDGEVGTDAEYWVWEVFWTRQSAVTKFSRAAACENGGKVVERN